MGEQLTQARAAQFPVLHDGQAQPVRISVLTLQTATAWSSHCRQQVLHSSCVCGRKSH
jgi:hypothetical protein